MTPLLTIQDLTVSFSSEGKERFTAVDTVSFTVPAGKTTCVVGESGSGKSVTARAILGLLEENGRIDRGQMLFAPKGQGGTDLARLDVKSPAFRALRGEEIAMIYQEPMSALSPLYTIGEQIGEVLRWHRGLSRKEARAAAIDMLRHVGMPEPEKRVDMFSFELSGGQRQRAVIAMALIAEPRLLIADEPTTAIDVTTQAGILSLLKQLQAERDMSMLFITHDLGVVAEIADEVVVMYRGKVMEQGPVAKVLTSPSHPYTRALLAARPSLTGKRGDRLPTVQDAFAPRNSQDEAPRAPRPAPDYSQPPLIKVRGLHKRFGKSAGLLRKAQVTHAVRNVSLELYEGETLGLVGESGSGKSTLGRCILGLLEPSEGEICRRSETGYDSLVGLPPKTQKQVWRDIRMVFQDPRGSFNPRMSVFDILADVLRSHGMEGTAIARRADELMRLVDLDPALLDRFPHAFSGGQRQRIGIARALAPSPRIVIADEAVSALDVSVQAQVLNLFADLQAELGLSYIFVSHDLSVVRHISDRVAVMKQGEIVELAPTDQIFEAPQHPYTRQLLDAVLEPETALARRAIPTTTRAPQWLA